MNLLAIDTVTDACSVALSGTGDTILERFQIESRGHSNLVLAMAEDVILEAGISRHDLNGIAFDSGPGSFTGIRIGLGVAQGLALAFDLPLLGVSSLMGTGGRFRGRCRLASYRCTDGRGVLGALGPG